MNCDLIKIGTSKGIRIPAILLKEMGNPHSFEIRFDKERLILIPNKKRAREDWSIAFQRMAKNNDDELIIDDRIDLDLNYLDEL